ncbi:ABC transporter substrate-binding protein [Kitasatospora sp. NPDC057015]|uniref:ABC transporter substrate-binding protein n=1 Tax=Kitasatospora sp. NPDC057015 TaxID=3346001 RepID=UPI003624F1B4
MCRLRGVVAGHRASPAGLLGDDLDRFLAVAPENRHRWGIGWVDDNRRIAISSEPRPTQGSALLAARLAGTRTDAAVLHLRLASSGLDPVLSSYTRGQSVEFARNEAYEWEPGCAWHTGPAYLDRFDLKAVTESSVRQGGLQSHQFDRVAAVAPANLARTAKDPKLKLLTHENSGINHVLLLNTWLAPIENLKVRRAFQSSISVEDMVKAVFFDYARAADGLFGPATQYHDALVPGQWGHDLDKAARLLDEAGWTARDADGYRTKDSVRLTVQLTYSDEEATAEEQTIYQAAAQQAKLAGFEVKLQTNARAAQTEIESRGDYDITGLFHVRAEPDIARTFFSGSFVLPNGTNYARVQDPTLEELPEKGLATPDGADREVVYRQVQQRVIAQAYVMPTYVPFGRIAVQNGVEGAAFATNSTPLFYDTWKH